MNASIRKRSLLILASATVLSISLADISPLHAQAPVDPTPVIAQATTPQTPASPPPTTQTPATATPATQPASSETPSPDDVMRKLDAMIKPVDETAPAATQPSATQPADASQDEPIVNPDKKYIRGVAPDVRVLPTRREDQFILNRVGRLVVIEPGKSLFIFDADQQTAQEQPMMVVPSQKLEQMENLTRDRGDRLRFIISGQILTYRDVNYLLPTIVRETEARSNLNQ